MQTFQRVASVGRGAHAPSSNIIVAISRARSINGQARLTVPSLSLLGSLQSLLGVERFSCWRVWFALIALLSIRIPRWCFDAVWTRMPLFRILVRVLLCLWLRLIIIQVMRSLALLDIVASLIIELNQIIIMEWLVCAQIIIDSSVTVRQLCWHFFVISRSFTILLNWLFIIHVSMLTHGHFIHFFCGLLRRLLILSSCMSNGSFLVDVACFRTSMRQKALILYIILYYCFHHLVRLAVSGLHVVFIQSKLALTRINSFFDRYFL